MEKIKLKYFSPEEFGRWWDEMSPELLFRLDLFRWKLGKPIMISPARGSLGREDGSTSRHNVVAYGEVQAADVMPEGLVSGKDFRQAVELAIGCGFTGVGLYPHWKPRPGLHLDVRDDHDMGDPALWGAVMEEEKQVYKPLWEVLYPYELSSQQRYQVALENIKRGITEFSCEKIFSTRLENFYP